MNVHDIAIISDVMKTEKFYYKDIIIEVPDEVYYPREDTLLLAKVLEKEELKGKKCLEMCCGSGFLSVLMVKLGADAFAVDINEKAVEATKSNAEKNSVKINAVVSDMFENIKERFDFILFNPPYLPDDTNPELLEKIRHESTKGRLREENIERQWSGGKSGREVIEKFVISVKGFMRKHAKIIMMISSLTGEKETKQLFEENGFSVKEIAREKIPWEELIVFEVTL